MSLICTECGTLSADGTAFCSGCGISLALATSTSMVTAAATATATAMATPSAFAANNQFPAEPEPPTGGARALPWLVGGVLLIVVVMAAITAADTGWQALQRAVDTSVEADNAVPVTATLPAAAETAADDLEVQDTAMPMEISPPTENFVADPPPPITLKAPGVAPQRAAPAQPRARAQGF